MGKKYILYQNNKRIELTTGDMFELDENTLSQHNKINLFRGYKWRIDLLDGYIWRVR